LKNNIKKSIEMIILVVNCGSSSLKYQLLDMKNDEVYDLLAKGLVERIGMEVGCLKHQATGKEKLVKEMPIADHTVGIQAVIDALLDKEYGVLTTLEDIEAVGHRVVHGAEEFVGSQLITDAVVAQLEKCSVFAPLHNPANILGIKAVSAVLPTVPQVGVFDTAFHQTMPAYAYMYALPHEYYDKYRIRRYGFHGTSHKYVSAKGAKFAGLDLNYSKIITCHLGNGSSIAAVVNGKSIDTTMGFTPLEGLIMGTRCGNVDPDVVTYIQEKEGLSPSEMSTVLNKKSGFIGLSGVSSDARDLNDAANEGNARAKLTLKKLTYDITKFIGAYTAAMNGVDLIVFTGGIGENNSRLRRRVCENLTYLGVKFDYDANTVRGEDAMLTLPDSKVKVALITTNEELMIARDTMEIVLNEEQL
jgi:acetate kinase